MVVHVRVQHRSRRAVHSTLRAMQYWRPRAVENNVDIFIKNLQLYRLKRYKTATSRAACDIIAEHNALEQFTVLSKDLIQSLFSCVIRKTTNVELCRLLLLGIIVIILLQNEIISKNTQILNQIAPSYTVACYPLATCAAART